jgi:hypothetical protein
MDALGTLREPRQRAPHQVWPRLEAGKAEPAPGVGGGRGRDAFVRLERRHYPGPRNDAAGLVGHDAGQLGARLPGGRGGLPGCVAGGRSDDRGRNDQVREQSSHASHL